MSARSWTEARSQANIGRPAQSSAPPAGARDEKSWAAVPKEVPLKGDIMPRTNLYWAVLGICCISGRIGDLWYQGKLLLEGR